MSDLHRISIRAAAATSIISGADPTEVSPSDPLRLFIIQASIIIILTRILAYFLAKLKQPSVIAEVIGGILLGPTVCGRIPGFTDHIFPTASIPYLNLVANLGLVLFLFVVGLEVDIRTIRKCAIPSMAISVAGLLVPFALGVAVSVGIYNAFIDTANVSFGHFSLFTGVAMGITALPVLARIVLDLKLIQTRVGVVVLAAGVGNDVVGWILLALAIALVNASSGINALYIFLVVLAWTLTLFFVVKPLFLLLARRTGSLMNGPTHTMMTATILLVFASAFLTDCIGVHAIFGAFLVGLIIPHEGGFAVALTEKIEDILSVIFLPLYFTLSGLSTNLATLDSGLVWGYVIAICIIAFFSKFLSCAGAARLTGFSTREAAAIGTLMSCKGLVELIVLNIGLSAGILNTQVFSMFVVMALVSTCATTPLTLLVYPLRHRTKYREGSVRSKEGNEKEEGASESHDAKGLGGSGYPSQRYLFVLDRFDHLPGLLSLVQLLRPTGGSSGLRDGVRLRRQNNSSGEADETRSSASHGVSSGHSENAEGVPELLRDGTQYPAKDTGSTFVDALRLIEMTERTSAVMRVAESDETLRADPLVNVFRTFVRLNKLPVHASMHVIANDEFSSTVVDRARDSGADLVVVPWTLPAAGTLGTGMESGASQSIFARPVETLFGTSTDLSDATRHYQAAFIRKVVQTSPCHVGLLLERPGTPTSSMSASWGQHIVFAFMGGPDDRCALELLLRWCRASDEVYVSVYRYQKTEAGSGLAGEDSVMRSIPATHHHGDTVRRTQATNALYGSSAVQDTMYPKADLNPLQAQLQDDVAIDAAEREREANQQLAQRFMIHECVSSTPLAHLIDVMQQQQQQQGASGEGEGRSLPPASLVVLGRNRRMPTITHRQELRSLVARARMPANAAAAQMGDGTPSTGPTSAPTAAPAAADTTSHAESRLIDSELCKIIGEAGMAVCGVGQSTVPTLVIASSLHQRMAGEDDVA